MEMTVCKECYWSGHPDELVYANDGDYHHVQDSVDERGNCKDGYVQVCPMCYSEELT